MRQQNQVFSQSPRDIASCVSGDQNMHFKKYILKIDVVDMTLTLDPHFVQRSCLFFSESWEKVDLYGSCAICVNNNTPLVPSTQFKPLVAQLNKLTS